MATAAPTEAEARDLPQVTLADRIRAVCMSPVALAAVCQIEGETGMIPFDLWPHQVEILRRARRHRFTSDLKSRQLGVTEAYMLLALWECQVYPVGLDLVVSINEREAAFAMSKVTTLYDSTPDWYKAAFPVDKRNVTEFSIKHGKTSSGVLCLPASGDAGRGRHFRRVIADERARWEGADERMASLKPTVADGDGRMNEVSTAKGYNGMYTTWTGGVDPPTDPALGNGYVRNFIPATARPGRSVEWVMRQRAGMEGDLGLQEYPLTPKEAWISSGGCIFDSQALDDLEEHSVRPASARVSLRQAPGLVVADPAAAGFWRVWEWPKPGRDYVIAADVCGGGGGRDASAAVVLDAQSWDEVACLHGRPEPEDLATELILAGWFYRSELWQVYDAQARPQIRNKGGDYQPALLIPEANGPGAATIAVLKERRYPRVYEAQTFDQRAGRTSTSLGWLTTAKSRPVALGALQAAVREGSAGVRFADAIGEMRRFEDPGNGRPEAAEGAHDDLVMAWAIAIAVLSHTRVGRPLRRTVHTPYKPRVSSRTGY